MSITVKAVVVKSEKKKDGTYNVKIRITHDRKYKFIPTNIFVSDSDLKKDFSFKSVRIKDLTSDLERQIRAIIEEMGMEVNYMSIVQIIDRIKLKLSGREESFYLDFCKYMTDYANGLPDGTKTVYLSSVSAIQRYTGKSEVDVNGMNYSVLQGLAEHINGGPIKTEAKRSVHLYMQNIRVMHSRAKDQFNDEESGIIHIPLSPFSKFKLPKEQVPEHTVLNPEQIRKLIRMNLNGRKEYSRDMFVLSFLLAGMNPADMYEADTIENGRIKYNRQKTKTRRADKAEMHTFICEHAKEIMDRYKSESRVLDCHKRYSSYIIFRENMTRALKKIGEEMGIDGLTMYVARHSWATIAVNEADVNEYTVSKALNHSVRSMQTTERYIKKDWSKIDEAILAVEEIIYPAE